MRKNGAKPRHCSLYRVSVFKAWIRYRFVTGKSSSLVASCGRATPAAPDPIRREHPQAHCRREHPQGAMPTRTIKTARRNCRRPVDNFRRGFSFSDNKGLHWGTFNGTDASASRRLGFVVRLPRLYRSRNGQAAACGRRCAAQGEHATCERRSAIHDATRSNAGLPPSFRRESNARRSRRMLGEMRHGRHGFTSAA